LKEGRIDALLADHTAHLEQIYGMIEKAADANLDVAEALRGLASDIRTLQEASRLSSERVKVAADTLAIETERRRKELAETDSQSDRRFSRREKLAGLGATLLVGLLTLVLRRSLGL
jgi:hypothetical protein